ncbi:MAG TPA: DUF4402 domain-containing protein [bacterium]|jgi:hypothetical protein
MTARLRGSPWQARGLSLALLAGALLLLAGTAQGQAIQITKLRDLDFGGCDNVGGATYTVAPAAAPGGGACFGATSAQFTVTGTPSRRARLTLPNTVSVSNGTQSLSAAITDSVGSNIACLGTGTITIYVGGSVTLPGGGLTSYGLFIAPTQIQLAYIGGSC